MRRSVWWSFALILATVAVGAALRFGHWGQPNFVRKYGGSVCWALEIYWVVSAVVRGRTQAAGVAGVIATAVEFFKLLHTPWLEWFRGTLAGVLLLGRFFSWWDVLAYWLAILLGVWLDAAIARRAPGRAPSAVPR